MAVTPTKYAYLTLDSAKRMFGTVDSATYDVSPFLAQFVGWRKAKVSTSYFSLKRPVILYNAADRNILFVNLNWSQHNTAISGTTTINGNANYTMQRATHIHIAQLPSTASTLEFRDTVSPDDRASYTVMPSQMLTVSITNESNVPITAANNLVDYVLVLALEFEAE